MLRVKLLGALAVLTFSVVGLATSADSQQNPNPNPNPNYQPTAVFCADSLSTTLCPVIPSNVGNDPPLKGFDYSGVFPQHPDVKSDVQSPFDNYSWQVFVALNWPRGTPPGSPAQQALSGDLGPRVWETWNRVSQVFGPAPGLADCGPTPAGLERFDIGSDTYGRPVGENEEYIQAATGDPVIDVSGNWTIYERRVNNVEVGFLKAPYGPPGHKEWTLTTRQGQRNLVEQYKGNPTVYYPISSDQTNGPNGAMELKAAWRILDPAKHAENIQHYYVRRAFLTVAPDLVRDANGQPGGKICAQVDLGLVAMHILQKNARIGGLQPQWIWSTFEHVDDAPLAQAPCDPLNPDQCQMDGSYDCPAALTQTDAHYSYFDPDCPQCSTNQPPTKSAAKPIFAWNPTQPYALAYLRTSPDGRRVGSQVSRCWSIYTPTASLNQQWQAELGKVGSVFANYMLVGSQWGFITVGRDPVQGFLPKYLANTLVETYLQRAKDSGDSSCMACHIQATLPNQTDVANVTSDFSFLPGLAPLLGHPLVRRDPLQ
jgi:hypothetical protein